MGVVYHGLHEETGREAAVKTVYVRDARYLASLRREIHALARIGHPGVVPIYDHGLDDGMPWYAMEIVEGQTLRVWSRRRLHTPTEQAGSTTAPTARERPLDDDERPFVLEPELLARQLSIVLSLCETLAFVHGEGIVHRDLKPSNVIVLPGGRPMLVDFGLSARSVARRDVLDVSAPWGTLSYMAPEQLRGHAVDARADLWSLGCILYELTTGTVPYRDPAEAFRDGTAKPQPPARRVEGVTEALSELVLALLEPDPRERLGYAGDVADHLRAMGIEPAVESPPPARPYLYRPDLVGRTDVLHLLTREFGKAQRGNPRVVYVGGESGVGKTRLGLEFALRIASGRARIVTGECSPVGGAPLAALTGLLQAVADRCQEGGAALTEQLLGGSIDVLRPYEPALGGVPGADPDAPELPPTRTTRARLTKALVDTTAALATDDCLLLVLDDLQWADELTLDYLRQLGATAPRGASLMVLGLYRGEERSAALGRALETGQRRMTLERLDGTATRAMVQSVLSSPDLPEQLVDSIAARAGGNPFYLAEYLQTAVDEGLLRREKGTWTATVSSAEELPLPEGIRELLDLRLGTLTPSAQRVIEAAAVIGRHVALDSLLEVSPLDESVTLDAITELLAHQLFEERDGDAHFAHDQLTEAAYRRIPEHRRASLHGRAARALERRLDGDVTHAQLAHHYSAAGLLSQALEHAESAGARALRAGSHEAATRHLERALELDEETGGAHLDDLGRARIERRLADARFALGDLDLAADRSRRALRLLGHPGPAGVPGEVALVARSVAGRLLRRARPLSAAGTAEEARLAEAALAAQKRAEVAYFEVDALPLVSSSLLAVDLAERAGHYPEVARTYAMLGVVTGASGLTSIAAGYFDTAKRSASMIDDLPGLVFARYAELAWLIGRAEWGRVAAEGEATMELARRLGDIHEINVVETCLGHSAYFQGRHQEALDRYREVARTARSAANRQHLAWGLYAQARSLVRLDRWPEAATLCREAMDVLEDSQDLASAIICSGLLALASTHAGDHPTAQQALEDAVARIRREGLPTMVFTLPGYEAVARVALGRWQAGDRSAEAQARAAIRSMRYLALNHPVARPGSALYAAWASRLRGHSFRAKRGQHRAILRARELGMPDEERLAAELL